MKNLNKILQSLSMMIISVFFLPMGGSAEELYNYNSDVKYGKEELTQMLAPIALYPDSLVAQILMAATYPPEIAEAASWLDQNRNMSGDELDKALQEKEWDPSVKSLCRFPDLLSAMAKNLDQTSKLGDAFLSQEDEVMATIQELRRMADDRGNLVSTPEQRVTDENEIITIEPTNPDVVYLPAYDPYYVFGTWWYPDYLPYYWYFPSGFASCRSNICFGSHAFFGYGSFSWCRPDWHTNRLHLDYSRIRHFDRRHHRSDFQNRFWRHDPVHRRGFPYGHARPGERHGSRILSPPVHNRTPGNYFYDTNRRGSATVSPNRTVERREGFRLTPHNNSWRSQRAPDRDHSFGRGNERRFDRGDRNQGGWNRNDNNFGRPVRNLQGFGSGHGHRNVDMGERGGGFAPHGPQIRQHGGDGRSPGRGTPFQHGGSNRGNLNGNGHFERGGGSRR